MFTTIFTRRCWLAAILTAMAVLFLGAPRVSAESLSDDEAAKLRSVIAGDHRTTRYSARDQFRHPYEVLSFFGVKPDMTVVELFPGGGWWTEILGPYLRENGRYYAANHQPGVGSERRQRSLKRYTAKLAARPDLYGSTKVTVLAPPQTAIAPAGSADVVLTFRNVHNWMKAGTAASIYRAMFMALKPGGVLGVVEHRGDPSVKQDPKGISGYVNQSHAIELAVAAGFRLVAMSEVNANPNDTKDHPAGVWTLPPGYRLKDKDRAKYQAIGESDRMTLKFIKPAG